MTKSKWIALVAALVLLGSAGCSSSSSSSGNAELNQIESDVSTLLQVAAFLLEQLPVTPAPAAENGNLGGVTCIDLSRQYCPNGGMLMQCENGSQFDIELMDCTLESVDGTVVLNGMLTYLSLRDWPSGERQVVVTTAEEQWAYGMTFDGTDTVVIEVEDLIDGTLADCVGSLETFSADCTLVTVQAPI